MKSISLILLLSVLSQVKGYHTCESRQASYFSKKKESRLVVSEKDVLFTRSAKQAESCLGICRENRSCRSINVEHGSNTHTCSFLRVDRLTLPLNVSSQQGHSYFEIYLPSECESIKYNRNPLSFAKDCLDVYNAGYTETGVYNIKIGNKQVNVLCFTSPIADKDGGWTVIQSRNNIYNVDFNQTWTEYKKGFGDLQTEFWLGNEHMHQMTRERNYQLIVDFTYQGVVHSVFHDEFRVGSETNLYDLFVKQHELRTDWQDQFVSEHNAMKFSTLDKDNDVDSDWHCARMKWVGWWFSDCGDVQLNNPHKESGWLGSFWYDLSGSGSSLSFVRMRIKPDT